MDTEIEEVKSEIKKLGQQIDDVVRQLTTAPLEDILYLRNKEEQLRNKEAQLRQERLLVEERLLLKAKAEASATLPWNEWVVQEMPPIPYVFGSRSSFQVVKDSGVPKEVKAWDIWPEVAQYVANVASKSAQLQRINMKLFIDSSPPIISSEASASFLYQAFLMNVGSNIIDGFSVDPEVSIKSLDNTQEQDSGVVALARGSSGGRADVALSCGNRTFIVVEMAAEDTTPHEWKGGANPPQDLDIGGTYETDKELDTPKSWKRTKTTETDKRITRSMTGAGSGLKETLEADLHLEKQLDGVGTL